MKRLFKRGQRVVKGTSSGVLISIVFHAALGAAALTFVVFRHLNEEVPVVTPPPPVAPPAIPLQKIQPKVKNPSAPKATAKITAKVDQVMPNAIQFPDMPSSGVGVGIGGEGGEGIEFPPLPTMDDDEGFLGKESSIGNDLEGTYYDFKRTSDGRYNGMGTPGEQDDYVADLNNFLLDWDISRLNEKYYTSPKKRYATCIIVPTLNSDVAPSAFGEDRASGLFWMVRYKGTIVYPEDITFRFWGAGDFFMGVRVDQEVVLFTAWQTELDLFTTVKWKSSDSQRDTYYIGGADAKLDVGDWITLKANEPKDIEIVLGDNGGLAGFALLVEVQGETYPQNIQGGPILPVFKTADLSRSLIDAIYKDLPTNECSLVGGPIFSDYSVTREPDGADEEEAVVAYADEPAEAVAEAEPELDLNALNKWTLADGTTFEARYRAVVAGNVIMDGPAGNQEKIPLTRFTPEDVEIFELARPPEFKLDIRRKSDQLQYSNRFLQSYMPQIVLESFGVRAKKMSVGEYNYPVTVEYFVVAAQLGFNDKFILVDHQETSYVPSRENDQTLEFMSPRVIEMEQYGIQDRPVKPRGKRYESYLILVKDKLGRVIATRTPNKWLLDNLENLRQRDIGDYMNDKCEQVYPGRPLPLEY